MEPRKIVAAVLFGALTLSQFALFAQAGPPGPGGGAPIDGGAVILLAGTAVYGYKMLKEKKVVKNN